uniref:Uncharacterized protein n=1 Tax=Ditylenchus dipsaci TaxID=166011 RepID=A0A915EPN9_9BILA
MFLTDVCVPVAVVCVYSNTADALQNNRDLVAESEGNKTAHTFTQFSDCALHSIAIAGGVEASVLVLLLPT